MKHYLRDATNETEAINLAEVDNPNGGDLDHASGTQRHLMVPPTVHSLLI
jgi:hypothetical protein